MTGLIVSGPSQNIEPVIRNKVWFPDVYPSQIREQHRIDTSITPQRLRMQLVEAMTHVNDQLHLFKESKQAEGFDSLANITADTIDDENVLVQRYRRAVGCLTKASLLERQRDYDTSGRASKEAEQLDSTISDLRRDALYAISDIVGKPRVQSFLI